ncbi:MAG: AMP-binding protein, partial [Actinomycetota bacterium]|nr:AMP-binding protein [Actinomycetota bacterium]
YTEDGWVVTGDIGRIDEDGYLSIIDRKKELIINAGGKNMSPAFIEAQIKGESLLVGQVVAIGDLRPYNVALIVLDPDHARVFAERNGLEDLTMEELAAHPLVKAEIDEAVERGNSRLSRVEGIKKYVLLGNEWVPGGEELTPTMKLKRRTIHEIYADQVNALYGE